MSDINKVLVTLNKSFYTKDGYLKSACWGEFKEEEDLVRIGSNENAIHFNRLNIFCIVECNEKPIELTELGFE